MSIISDELEYDDHLEKLLKEQAEIAESLSILHRNAHRKFGRFTNWINIPVIIGSSVVGFTTGLDLSYINNINIILGIISVFIGIIKSLDSYFQLGRISETHRMVSLAYAQINKKIAIELALNRKDRISPKDMLSIVKTDVKNLEDVSPLLPQDIIDSYKKEFGHDYVNVKKPNITSGLSPVEINRGGDRPKTSSATVSADMVHAHINNQTQIIDIPTMSPQYNTVRTILSEYRTNGSNRSHHTDTNNNGVPYADVNSSEMGITL